MKFRSLLSDASTQTERSIEYALRELYQSIDKPNVAGLRDPYRCESRFLPYLADDRKVLNYGYLTTEEQRRNAIEQQREVYRNIGKFSIYEKIISIFDVPYQIELVEKWLIRISIDQSLGIESRVFENIIQSIKRVKTYTDTVEVSVNVSIDFAKRLDYGDRIVVYY